MDRPNDGGSFLESYVQQNISLTGDEQSWTSARRPMSHEPESLQDHWEGLRGRPSRADFVGGGSQEGASMLAAPAMRSVDYSLDIDSGHMDSEDVAMRWDVSIPCLPRNNSDCSLESYKVDWRDIEHVQPVHPDEVSSIASTFSTCLSQFTDRDASEMALGDFALNDDHTSDEVYVPSANKCFKTLSEALKNSSDGDEIQLTPGLYVVHGRLEVEAQNVTLCGALLPSSSQSFSGVEIQLRGPHSSLVCKAKGLKVFNIKLVQCSEVQSDAFPAAADQRKAEENSPACINVQSGDAYFEACKVTSSLGHGICVWEDAAPTFRLCCIDRCFDVAVMCRGRCMPTFVSNTLRKNKSFAIAVMNSCAGRFVGNTVVKTAKCAIVCAGTTTSVFIRNSISDGMQGAFWVQASSRAAIVENTMLNNLKAGLQVSNDADPSVTGNKILKGDGGGIVVHDYARGTFRNNILEQNMRAGIGVLDHAAPTFIGNIVRGNEGGGAVVTGYSAPVFSEDQFSHNGFVAVGVKEHSTPLFSHTTVSGNNGYGMLLQASCCVQLLDSTVVANQRAGVCLCDTAQLVMTACTVEPGDAHTQTPPRSPAAQQPPPPQLVGLLLHGKSKVVVTHSVVRHHAGSNIAMHSASTAAITSSAVSDADYGLKMYDNSSAVLRHNSFVHHKEVHILVSDTAVLRACNNSIIDGRGCGVKSLRSAQCALSHNSIMGNLGMGVESKSRGALEMRANRVSANGQFGVLVDGASLCCLKANVIFGNQFEALHLEHVSQPTVQGNCIMRGKGQALVLGAPPPPPSGIDRSSIDVTLILSNFIQLDSGTRDKLPAFFHENNLTTIDFGARMLVRHSLEVLENWKQCRAGHRLIRMPDGSLVIATPTKQESKAFQQPVPRASCTADPRRVALVEIKHPDSHADRNATVTATAAIAATAATAATGMPLGDRSDRNDIRRRLERHPPAPDERNTTLTHSLTHTHTSSGGDRNSSSFRSSRVRERGSAGASETTSAPSRNIRHESNPTLPSRPPPERDPTPPVAAAVRHLGGSGGRETDNARSTSLRPHTLVA